jgi:hypothetical protein
MPRTPGGEPDSARSPLFPPSVRAKSPPGNFAVYRIALRLPENTLGFVATQGRPEIRVELINRLELPNDLLMLECRVFGPGAGSMAAVAKNLAFVRRVEVHPETSQSALYRITLQPPLVWKLLQQHRILTRYPIIIVDGWMRFETLAPAGQIRQLMKALAREVGPSRVEAIRQGAVTGSALGLTRSQETVFREALASGYFGSPRRTSLTNLAKRLGRSKSTVSQQLALIQRRLAESALRLRWAPMVYPG